MRVHGPRHAGDDAARLSELSVPIRAGDRVLCVIDTEHAARDHYDSRHVRARLHVADAGAARLLSLEPAPAPPQPRAPS